MGERKVLNKYYPPDFDPALLPKKKQPPNMQIKVRVMLPMSIRCNTCGEYLYRGKKFNSRKEDAQGEDYLGIQIFRFYIKCVNCNSEITFKTDPENSDYAAEHGCTRNFEPWRDHEDKKNAQIKKREDEEENNAMKALENRTMDSKMEIDILDALGEVQSLNAAKSKVNVDDVIQKLTAQRDPIEDEEVDFEQERVLRLEEDDEEERWAARKAELLNQSALTTSTTSTTTSDSSSGEKRKAEPSIVPAKKTMPVFVVKPKKAKVKKEKSETESTVSSNSVETPASVTDASPLAGLGGYGSGSASD